MTLLVTKHCSDGVLLIADSVSKPENGPTTNNAKKTLHGFRGSVPFAVVFAGFAGNVGGPQTLDTIRHATSIPTGLLQDNIRDAIKARLKDEAESGDWNNENGEIDEEAREEFRTKQKIIVLLGVGSGALWIISATAAHQDQFELIKPGNMAISQPGPDKIAFEQLKELCNHTTQTLIEATQVAAMIFDKACLLFPNDCTYPGVVLFLTATRVTQANFATSTELQTTTASWLSV